MIFMYERVIVPTDGSRVAERGVLEGLKMAKNLNIPAHSIYVLETKKYEHLKGSKILPEDKKNMKKVAQKALEWVWKRAQDAGVDCTTDIMEGDPYELIVSEAGKRDIIYISSHGSSGFRDKFIGSTADRVLKHAHCTVAVVKNG